MAMLPQPWCRWILGSKDGRYWYLHGKKPFGGSNGDQAQSIATTATGGTSLRVLRPQQLATLLTPMGVGTMGSKDGRYWYPTMAKNIWG